jgi:hypothetical protein
VIRYWFGRARLAGVFTILPIGLVLQIGGCAVNLSAPNFRTTFEKSAAPINARQSISRRRNDPASAKFAVVLWLRTAMHSRNGRPPSPAFKAAAEMPALRHFHRGRPFDIMESEVAAWLCDQPELRQEIFNWCKRLGCILYIDGKWIGAKTYAAETQSAVK